MSELNKITIDGIEYDLPSGGGEVPENIVLLANDSTPSTPTPRDADMLGGHDPSYYAKQSDVDSIETGSTEYKGLVTSWIRCGHIAFINIQGATTSDMIDREVICSLPFIPLMNVAIKSSNCPIEYDFVVRNDNTVTINGTMNSGFRVRATNTSIIVQ